MIRKKAIAVFPKFFFMLWTIKFKIFCEDHKTILQTIWNLHLLNKIYL